MENSRPADHAAFVEEVFNRKKNDKGFGAKMRRADNPDTEDQCYFFLSAKGIDLTDDSMRLPYALVGAAICRAQAEMNGNAKLGEALAGLVSSADAEAKIEDSPAAPRLRRLLACDSTMEACQVLRPMLSYIADKSKNKLDFARLLKDLLNLDTKYGPTIKRRWAMEFYGYSIKDDTPGQEGA